MKFKIDLRPGTKLSEIFSNSRDCYKVVEVDYVLGYVVSRGGRESAAAIYPLYRADIHVKAGKTWHVVSSYEQGKRLNGFTFHDDYDDYEGCTFGTIAAQAISALEERRHVRQLVDQAQAKKRRRKRSR